MPAGDWGSNAGEVDLVFLIGKQDAASVVFAGCFVCQVRYSDLAEVGDAFKRMTGRLQARRGGPILRVARKFAEHEKLSCDQKT